jgi:hypothetical protein
MTDFSVQGQLTSREYFDVKEKKQENGVYQSSFFAHYSERDEIRKDASRKRQMRNAYRRLIRKVQRKRPFERPGNTLKD